MTGKENTLKDDCSPMATNDQMGKIKSWNGKTLKGDDIASPCGLIAASLFNGIYLVLLYF